MKSATVSCGAQNVNVSVHLPASKSISNRVLILQEISENNIQLLNLSKADDTLIMQSAINLRTGVVNVKNAGTCMRFLTAFFATHESDITVKCDERMKKRPIAPLVDSLRKLGADISYLEKDGFPPLKIKGKQLEGGIVSIDASQSSQFVSALMLVAPSCKDGLQIELTGEKNSESYIEMTIGLMQQFGYEISVQQNRISIAPQKSTVKNMRQYYIESDWSSASYWYEIAALCHECEITLQGLRKDNLQGDAVIAEYMNLFGVRTSFINDGVTLSKNKTEDLPDQISIDLSSTPDLAPALAVTAAAKNISAELTGLKNLRIKESDRLLALETELGKCGFEIQTTEYSINIIRKEYLQINGLSQIETYNDHRIAMAFAPLCLLYGTIRIENPAVVAKSYPEYWEDLKRAGFDIR